MKEETPLVFNYADIRTEGGLSLKLSPSPADYADAFDKAATLKKIDLELDFSVGGDSILLEGRVSAELELQCARCAEPLTLPFEDTFDEVYPDTVEYIDTREVIRETVALLVPLKVLCSEACKGRCLVCGINRNVQVCACRAEKASTFEGLKGLKIKDLKNPGNNKL